MFSSHGEVTDLKIVKTKQGTSRKFCFVGFKKDEEASAAIKYFNKTFIGSSRVEVEIAKPYGDETIARPWSKYSIASSAYKKKHEVEETDKTESKPAAGKNKLEQLLEDYTVLEQEQSFQEFLDVHNQRAKVKTWSDASGSAPTRKMVEAESSEGVESVSEEELEEEELEATEEPSSFHEQDRTGDVALSACTSDLDYLRSKVVKEEVKLEETAEQTRERDRGSKLRKKKKEMVTSEKSFSDSDTEWESDSNGEVSGSGKVWPDEKKKSHAATPYTIKMLGLPFTASERDVETFFHPISLAGVRFTQDDQGRPSGRGYVDFHSKADLSEALKRNKDCIRHRYIELFRDEGVAKKRESGDKDEGALKPWEVKASMGGDGASEPESITESGRIFVRNLSYSASEEDLEDLFGRFGPVTETSIPLDRVSNKPRGVAFISFMLPEHAVKAFQELDGQIFQGRLLHLLPARPKVAPPTVTVTQQKSSYKKEKDVKEKSEAGRGHNWNSLFLGTNAVSDVMAEKYKTDKSIILDTGEVGGASAAVRMALGETEVVRETREFLQEHGVDLSAFQEERPTRSRTVILVKNLPSGTSTLELTELFQMYGQLVRVVIPPAGITALVEFAEPSHARLAFSKLAYTSFKHLPLYLEWAPANALRKGKNEPPQRLPEDSLDDSQEPEVSENTGTVFVKNLSFSTSEDALKKLFSSVGEVRNVLIAKKRNIKDPSKPLSMGYGFVEFESEAGAKEAVKLLQNSSLDSHNLELKISKHRTKSHPSKTKTSSTKNNLRSSKILVRNIPFEASKKEVQELFSTFGALKMARLPKKLLGSSGSGQHRGFGFVEFVNKEDAAKAFDALRFSTHLYGRRLVLEWAAQEESLDAIRKRTAQHFDISSHEEKKKRKQLALDLGRD